jgi:hypothetical protein
MMIKRVVGLALALIAGLAPIAFAQSSGNVYGTVADESGAVLPGATVDLTGASGDTRSTTSGTQGDFRFLNLPNGKYTLKITLPGFATTKRDITVNTGTNVNVGFSMKVATREESVIVTDESPVVDIKKVGTATTLTQEELARVPQGRDPWAVLNMVPGVVVDRVSVAGNEAGQQSLFVGKGAQITDTMWTYDGVNITDVTSYGASSSYFDFDSFDEINVTTGAGDLKVQTGGIGLNFVTKRGTNTFHGSGRSFFSHDKMQSNNTPAELAGSSALKDGKADHIEQINDWGFDLAGPIIKDKLWFWGSYNKNDIRLYRLINAAQDKTILKNYNAKLNWHASPKDQVSANWFWGAKEKFGRDPGYAGRNQALWNQGNFFEESDCGLPCGLQGLSKVDWSHTFGPNFFMSAKYAFYNWGYGFDSATGDDQDLSIDRVADTAKGSAQKFRFLKPWHNAALDGSYFANGMGGNHELKFGFAYRHNPNTSSASYGGNSIVAIHNNDDAGDPTSRVAQVWRNGSVKFEGNYTSLYLGDTFTKDRFTLNAGLRWDRQTASLKPSTASGNPLFPEILPDLTFDGNVPGIKWNDISPRVGVSYALDQQKRTVVRGSYARYAGQLGPIDAQFNSPITYNYTYLAYRWVDRNGDGFAQKGEILTDQGVLYYAGINPDNPAALSSVNKIDPNYHAPHDQEVIAGIEHQLAKNFSVGAALTWRKGTDTASYTPRIDDADRILTAADFLPMAPVSAGGFTVNPFEPDPNKTGSGGRLLTNRPNHSLDYKGFELTAIKRMADRWMMRASVSYIDWSESIKPGGFQNPTSADIDSITQGGYPGGANSGLCGPCKDGGPVLLKSYGAKTNSYISADWIVSASGLYELGRGFDVGASFYGRQGYPVVPIIRTSLGADGNRRLIPQSDVTAAGRYDTFWNLDLRAAKTIKLGGSVSANLTLDAFNIFNNDKVLQRNRQINSDAYFDALEVPNPRILRLGVRLQF